MLIIKASALGPQAPNLSSEARRSPKQRAPRNSLFGTSLAAEPSGVAFRV